MRRTAAFLGAVLLVVLAVVVRNAIDDAGSEGGPGGGTVVCATELAEACQNLAASDPSVTVVVEDAWTTVDTLSAPGFDPGAAAFAAWVAPAPFVQIVREQRARASLPPVLGESSGVLARSPLVLAAWKERVAALAEPDCQGGESTWTCVGALAADRQAAPGGGCTEIAWPCIGDIAGDPWPEHGGQQGWGEVKPGHPPPDTSATGLLTIAQGTGEFLGRPEFASNDLDDPAWRAWFEKLERNIPTFTPPAGTPLDQMLFTGPSSFDMAGSVEAVAGPAIATSREKDRLAILYPAPVATMDVVATPVADTEAGDGLRATFESAAAGEALAAAGWRVEGRAAVTGVREDVVLPDDDGLPSPGVLEALRTSWKEMIG